MKNLVLSALALSVLPAPGALADTFAYVSLAGDSKIAIYRMDAQSGKLTRTGEVAVEGAPGALAVDPDRKYLFASLRPGKGLASFRIDPGTGQLTPIGKAPVTADAAFVGTDATGRYLLSAYYAAGEVRVHTIQKDGTLGEEPLQTVTTDKNAHSTILDPRNRFVFVPHTGPNAIFQFHFNVNTGKLTPNTEAKVEPMPGTGPRHLRFHPTKPLAYTSDENGSSVSGYSLDGLTGRLSRFQTLTTLPAGFQGSNTTAEVKIHPSGRFVYISNRGHDSIAGFEVQESGTLRAMGQTPTEKTPRSFDIDPTGRFLYAGGQGSTHMAAYRIDAATGKLTQFDTYEVGKQPAWVLIVPLK